ncbi:MAG: hypothetical protein ACP5HZ_12780 [Ferrimicrobium sp.]
MIKRHRVPEGLANAATSSTADSMDPNVVAAAFWMRSPDLLAPAMAWSPPSAQIGTYPKE